MQLSAMLDLFICLAFMYFLLSLIASYAQELIAGFLNWRGTYLSKGIDVIMDNDPKAKFGFYGTLDWLKAHFTPYKGQTIGDRFRADVKADPAKANPVLQQVLDVQNHPLMSNNPATVPSYVSAKNFSLAMLGVLQNGSQSPLFSQAEATIAALPPGDLKTTLSLFVQTAAGDVDKFRASLESWFDDAMDRVSGIYKRLAQYVMFVLGFILAATLNVDTSHVVRVLWESPSLRSTLVAQASQAVPAVDDSKLPDKQEHFRQVVANFEKQEFPVGWRCWRDLVHETAKSNSPTPADTAPPACPNTVTAAARTLEQIKADRPADEKLLTEYIGAALPGWILTAFAVSLGAPFWFGLLQQIVNLRNAGTKPDRADALPTPSTKA